MSKFKVVIRGANEAEYGADNDSRYELRITKNGSQWNSVDYTLEQLYELRSAITKFLFGNESMGTTLNFNKDE